VQYGEKEFLLSQEDATRQQTRRSIYATALEQAHAALRLEETEVPCQVASAGPA
jgi:hypothetical protein